MEHKPQWELDGDGSANACMDAYVAPYLPPGWGQAAAGLGFTLLSLAKGIAGTAGQGGGALSAGYIAGLYLQAAIYCTNQICSKKGKIKCGDCQ
ncbi:hypothetical protein [Verrucomicrobium sp. GAS474]|uniref:hypothetical protein n=1 Tax=Verrucomicrobium sp. GAS474 TaxID=1882831 RepID=UPI001E57B0AF|nr:hypothetical protein [Verrucomicrobium sp. GAS474]